MGMTIGIGLAAGIYVFVLFFIIIFVIVATVHSSSGVYPASCLVDIGVSTGGDSTIFSMRHWSEHEADRHVYLLLR
jgi:hypothetical protein